MSEAFALHFTLIDSTARLTNYDSNVPAGTRHVVVRRDSIFGLTPDPIVCSASDDLLDGDLARGVAGRPAATDPNAMGCGRAVSSYALGSAPIPPPV